LLRFLEKNLTELHPRVLDVKEALRDADIKLLVGLDASAGEL
jgi:hypothetical protein